MQLRDRLKNYLNRRAAYRFFIKDWVALGDVQTAAQVVSTMRFTRNLTPIEMEMPQASRILVVAPHPDDEAIGIGGTIARMSQADRAIRVVFASSDSTLRTEAAEAASVLGFEPSFLPHEIGHLPLDALADELAQEISSYRPTALFVPFFLDDHDDHRRISHALVTATIADEVPKPEIWAYQVYTSLIPNVVVDITAHVDIKQRAIECYRSQASVRDWSHWALGLNAFNTRFLTGRRPKSYAEAFFALPFAEYIDLSRRYFGSGETVYYSAVYKEEPKRDLA